ncbi:hypothetical protein LTR66_007067 [Elasticomyces elasticus]|nr:hypothetical protein LTR66_007067 [Elasticomyces elasticus]
MSFRVPDTSDPPSTPDGQRKSFMPSTTPAGPPPTNFTQQSFTPAGAPPSSVFGSTMSGVTSTFAKPSFAPSGLLNNARVEMPSQNTPFSNLRKTANGKSGRDAGTFGVPESSSPHYGAEGGNGAQYSEEEDDRMSVDKDDGPSYQQSAQSSPKRDAFRSSRAASRTDSPRGLKRSRHGLVMSSSLRSSKGAKKREPRESVLPGIAKGIATSMRSPGLQESDNLVLQTERLLSDFDVALRADDAADIEERATEAAQQLIKTWDTHVQKGTAIGSIGPARDVDDISKANYLATLLLQLHHPSPVTPQLGTSRSFYGRSGALTHYSEQTIPLPKALLDWLNTYHNPFPEDLVGLMTFKPDPAAHESFWDTCYNTQLRGNFSVVLRLLKNANFEHADSALDDGLDQPGYFGRQLNATNDAVNRFIKLLESCPAITDNDWDVKGPNWSIFRNKVRQGIADLEAFATSAGTLTEDEKLGFGFVSTASFGASKRADNVLPKSIRENLRILHRLLLGSSAELTLTVQDWLEASVLQAIWWDGEDEDASQDSLATSRRLLRRSQHTRQADVSPLTAYRQKLALKFADVADDPEDAVFSVNTNDPVQVALACVLEDHVEGAVGIIHKYSVLVAAAVVDIASAGGWLPEARLRSAGIMDGFDQEDLMVLSHGQDNQSGLQRDDVLVEYADLLAGKDELRSTDHKTVKEGWELACNVLNRLDSAQTASQKIDKLLMRLPLDSQSRVDKILGLCNALDLGNQVRAVSERYADMLADTTHSYGTALLYYARAHNAKKLKNVVDLLVSMCLVQSASYPPSAALDPQLKQLVENQRRVLTDLAHVDVEAAQLISTHLSGYATIRKFYDLRDEEVNLADGAKPTLRPLARKREAANALLVVIGSAADGIRGGLFDSEVDTVVQVDGLLALLGEALPLLNQPKKIFSPEQVFALLRAVEDLQTVTRRVYQQAETLFKSAMGSYSGSPATSPHDLLKKSISGLTGSSYSLVGESMLARSHSGGSALGSEGSGVLVDGDVKRGWDWRAGVAALQLGRKLLGEDVLSILRVELAREAARAWGG